MALNSAPPEGAFRVPNPGDGCAFVEAGIFDGRKRRLLCARSSHSLMHEIPKNLRAGQAAGVGAAMAMAVAAAQGVVPQHMHVHDAKRELTRQGVMPRAAAARPPTEAAASGPLGRIVA